MNGARFVKFSARAVAYIALMTALTYVGTILGFSSAQFYFNLSDSVILVCAALFGPIPAMIAGGLGCFLGDLTVYPATMLYTLFIKALEGLLAGVLFNLVYKLTDAMLARGLAGEMKAFMHKAKANEISNEEMEACAADAISACEASPLESVNMSYEDGKIYAVPKSCDTDGQPADDKTDIPPENGENDLFYSASVTNDSDNDPNDGESVTDNAAIEKTSLLKRRVTAIKTALTLCVCIVGGALMMTGYFVCQTFFYGTYASAMIALPLDAVQAACSSALATVLLIPLDKLRSPIFKRRPRGEK